MNSAPIYNIISLSKILSMAVVRTNGSQSPKKTRRKKVC